MARPRKAPDGQGLTVLVDEVISDGKGGWLKAGDTVQPVDDEAKESLVAKGLAK